MSIIYEKNNKHIINMLFIIYIFTINVFASTNTHILKTMYVIVFAFIVLNMILTKIPIHLGVFIFILLAFVLINFLSTYWSLEPNYAFIRSITLMQMLIMLTIFYSYFHYTKDEEVFINAFILSGFATYGYLVYYYGIDEMFNFSKRLPSDLMNSNLIGMNAAFSALSCIYAVLKSKKIIKYLILLIPMLAVIFKSASRKALICLVLGAIFYILFYIWDTKKLMSTIIKIFVFIIILVVAINIANIILPNNIAYTRFNSMISYIDDGTDIDTSTYIRMRMIEAGLDMFINSPIVGIGADNPKIYVTNYGIRSTYLHNNYVELLAGLGIIGFTLYYSLYIYLIVKVWPMVKKKDALAGFAFIIMILNLILDYGAVSYFSYMTYIYFIFALCVVTKDNANQYNISYDIIE